MSAFHRALAAFALAAVGSAAGRAEAQAPLSGTSSSTSSETVAPPSGAPVQAMPLVFEGNVVFIPEVYRAVLQYAGWADAPKDPKARGRWLEDTLEDFLHASGYELASVVAVPRENRYELIIDEGRLDKIIFRNVDPWTTVQLIFLLELPGKVFNRDLVERGLQRVREKMSVRSVTYEVVPLDEPEHQRLQIDDPNIIEGLTLFRPGEPHELRVSFVQEDRRAGLEVGLDIQAPDGLVVHGSYLDPGVLVRADRIFVTARAGVRIPDIGSVPGNRLGLSQAGAGVQWSTPAVGDILRFTAGIDARLEARRREDLQLVNYFFAPIRGDLGVSLESDVFRFNASGGVEQRFFFEPRVEEDASAPVLALTRDSSFRPFAEAKLSFMFNPSRLRRDRPHELELSGRLLWATSDEEGSIRELAGNYRFTTSIGFDELRFGLRGAWMDGDVPFFSEVPMGGGFLRSAFQGTVFARRVAALALEYRFSLARDTLKLSLFNDLALYDSLDLVRISQGLEIIENPGVGLHVLLIDAFQVNTYVGLGIRGDGETDVGFSVDITQAF